MHDIRSSGGGMCEKGDPMTMQSSNGGPNPLLARPRGRPSGLRSRSGGGQDSRDSSFSSLGGCLRCSSGRSLPGLAHHPKPISAMGFSCHYQRASDQGWVPTLVRYGRIRGQITASPSCLVRGCHPVSPPPIGLSGTIWWTSFCARRNGSPR